MQVQSVMSDPGTLADNPFLAGHLGELTRIVSGDLVDAAEATCDQIAKPARRKLLEARDGRRDRSVARGALQADPILLHRASGLPV